MGEPAQRPISMPDGVRFEGNVAVAVSDGAILRLNIYRPDKPGRYPVVMLMGPYGKDTAFSEAPPYARAWTELIEHVPSLTKSSSGRLIRWEAPDPECWVPDGYVMIHADSRGSNASPGLIDLWSPRQTEDYANLITWASRQSWSNGKVGLLGISYYAMNQWQVAARQPEGLAAIIPWEGAFDHYRDVSHHGGIPSKAFVEAWYQRQIVVNQNGFSGSPYRNALTGEPVTGEPLADHLLALNRVALADMQAAQPFDGAYYRQFTADGSRIKVPILSAGNWGGHGLHGRGNIEGYLAAASKEKWLRLHVGDHVYPFYQPENVALQKRFFDFYLKGEANGWNNEAPIQLAIRYPDRVEWRTETEWPLTGTDWQKWHLDCTNLALDRTLPEGRHAERSYAATGEGVTFMSAAFEAETEFTGPVKLYLDVGSSTSDMDIFATLRLIDRGGQDVTFVGATEARGPVSQGWLRVSHRRLDPARSTPWRPFHSHLAMEPMTPGEHYAVEVEIWATSIVVPVGYRLALTLQGRDWSLPGTEGPMTGSGPFLHVGRDPSVYGGTNFVFTGGSAESYLLLPHIPEHR